MATPSTYYGSAPAPYLPGGGLYIDGTFAPSTYVPIDQGSVLGASTSTPFSPSGGGGGGGSAQPAYDPQALAYYDNQIGRINTQMGQLDPQFNTGRQNIFDAYQTQANQLGNQEAIGQRNYNTSRTNTIQDNETAKQGIDSRVRTNTNALQRVLGRAGSGNSSAVQVLAPYAAGRAGSQERGQVQQAYGRNLQALDTNWGDFQNNLGTARTDLGRQRDTQVNSLQDSINRTRAGLLGTLSDLTLQRGQAAGKSYTDAYAGAQPYVSQIDQLMGQSANLGRQYQNPVLQAAPVAYQAPSLGSYDYSRTAGPQAGQAEYADQLTPYQFLFGNRRQQSGF